MPGFKIHFPLKGLSDNAAFTEQGPGSTSDALNMRSLDPVTGRERGAQREGLSKFMTAGQTLSPSKVAEILSISYDLRTIDYSAVGGSKTDTAASLNATTPDGGKCYALGIDKQENIYAINGAMGIAKYNSDLELVWEHGITGLDEGQVLKTMAVDDVGGVFVANAEGGDQEKASIWRVVEELDGDDDPQPKDNWNIQPGGFVKWITFKDSLLYVVIDKDDLGISEVVVYGLAATSVPIESRRFEVPYPVNHIDASDKGDMVVSCPVNTNRGIAVGDGLLDKGIHPGSPDTAPSVVGWTPKDLDDWEKRVWCWLDADDIAADLNIEVGEEVTFWRSRDKVGRHLYTNTIDDDSGPTLINSLAGHLSVAFDGETQSMISGPAGTSDKSSASSQLTSIPVYEGAMWVMFVLFKPTKQGIIGSPESYGGGALWSQYTRGASLHGSSTAILSNLTPNQIPMSFWANEYVVSGLTAKVTARPGRFAYFSPEQGGVLSPDFYKESATSTDAFDYPRHKEGSFTFHPASRAHLYAATHNIASYEREIKDEYYNEGDLHAPEDWSDEDPAVLLTIIHDGSVDTQAVTLTGSQANGGPNSGKTRSLIRVNGVPLDRWTDKTTAAAVEAFTRWGKGTNPNAEDATGHLPGEIMEILVLDRKDRNDDATEPKILTHPYDPDYIKSLTLNVGGTGYDASGDLRAIIQKGTTDDCGGAHMPQTGHALFGTEGAGATYRSYVKVGTYTSSGGVINSISLQNSLLESGWGWLEVPDIHPDSDSVFSGQSGTGATFNIEIHEDYSGVSVLDDETTTLEKIEGYMCHKRGVSRILPAAHDNATTTDRWAHPYSTLCPQGTKADGTYGGDSNAFLLEGPIIAQYDAAGTLTWAHGKDIGGAVGPKCGASAGFLSSGKVVSYGKFGSTHGASLIFNDGANSSNLNAMSVVLADQAILAVDEFDFVHYPENHASPDSDNSSYFGTDDLTATERFNFDIDSGTDDARDAYHVVVSLVNPDYEADFSESLYRARHAYVACSGVRADGTVGQPNIYKFPLVTTAANTNAPRAVKHFAISGGGELKSFAASGSFANLTTGDETPDFSATTKFIDHTTLFNKIYITDGEAVKVIDPKDNSVALMKADDGGKIPDDPKLVTAWRGRLVMAHLADDAHAFVMSEKDNPNGWDLSFGDEVATSATAGSLALSGKPQDVINCLIPYSDDILIFGCANSIWYLTGDPLLGGQLDLMTDITGMAFGRPWTKDPRGNIYFFGSRGGIFGLAPGGGAPVKLTEHSIDRRMSDIDLATYRIELAWNERQDGFHVFQIPYGAGGTIAKSWFWDRKLGGFWEDEFGSTGVQATAVRNIEGDTPAERVFLVGGEDGVIRKYDEAAKDDDGSGIEARVLFGPLLPDEGEGMQLRFSHLAVTLASDQDGAVVRGYVSDTADEKGEPVYVDNIGPGRNPYLLGKVKGGYAWVELVNGAKNERFAFERMAMRAYPAGRQRVER